MTDKQRKFMEQLNVIMVDPRPLQFYGRVTRRIATVNLTSEQLTNLKFREYETLDGCVLNLDERKSYRKLTVLLLNWENYAWLDHPEHRSVRLNLTKEQVDSLKIQEYEYVEYCFFGEKTEIGRNK